MVADVMEACMQKETGLKFVGDSTLDALRPERREDGGVDHPHTFLAGLGNGPGREGKLPLGRLLQGIARRSNTSFHIDARGWIRCRNTLYFLGKQEGLCADKTSELFAPVVRAGSYRASDAMRVAPAISHDQAEALSRENLRFLPDIINFRELVRSWVVFRLLGSLGDKARKSLESGDPLPYPHLTSAEQTAVRRFLTDVSVYSSDAPLDLELTPNDFRGLILSLKIGQQEREFTLSHRAVKDPLFKLTPRVKWE